MKTILFSTDFTDSTTDALNWARLFARHYHATLVLVHVQSAANAATPIVGNFGMGAGAFVDSPSTSPDQLAVLADQLRAEGSAYLRRGIVSTEGRGGLPSERTANRNPAGGAGPTRG